MASRELFECSVCRASFRVEPELTAHLEKSPDCKAVPKKSEPFIFSCERNATTIQSEILSQIVPETVAFVSRSPLPSKTSKLDDGTLLAAMEAGMKKMEVKPKRKSGLGIAILSAIADGDEELASAYSSLPLDPVTGERILNEEIVSSVTMKSKINVARVAAFLSRAQHVTICFLLDTTGSMDNYITGVKQQIVEIVDRVKMNGCYIEGLAFVGYKDWCDGDDHFEVLPFTKSIFEFKDFVADIEADGGGDFPEDVLGGLHKAISLSWPERSGTRIIFHLGDAPPHGKKFYHDRFEIDDDYENGHPCDLPLPELFNELHRKELMYYFGRIDDSCDKMISLFERYNGKKIDVMNNSEVGTICSAVTESVSKSISVTYRAKPLPPLGTSKDLRKYTLDGKEPDWCLLPRYEGIILTFNFPDSIKDITSFAKLGDSIKKCRIQIAPNPFAKGSVRLAYYGRIFFMTKDVSTFPTSEIIDDVVFKEIITLPKNIDVDRHRYMTDLEVQTVAAKLAFEFNGKLCRTSLTPVVKLKFLRAKVVRIFTLDFHSSPRFLAYEKRFRENSPMNKYTNNWNYVLNPEGLDEDERRNLELAVAFSHFTYDVTDGYLLVCDLQGVSTRDSKDKETLLLTDPAIHCAKHFRFGKTNFGHLGMKEFFKKHKCNKYCQALELRIPGHIRLD